MGLTLNSTGIKSVDMGFEVKKINESDKIIALAGNPNVGKSTVFNSLTGLRQHTGNWPGKTVSNAWGVCEHNGKNYIMVDIPGTYSLLAHSREEEVAGDFICFGNPDAVIVVCDATCLERNLNLVLQTIEITDNVIVCVNLMDEAKKKNIRIDLHALSAMLGVPVVGTSARKGKGLSRLMNCVGAVTSYNENEPLKIKYLKPIEDALDILTPVLSEKLKGKNISPRWAALKIISDDKRTIENIINYTGADIEKDSEITAAADAAGKLLQDSGMTGSKLKDSIVSCIILTAESICNDAVTFENEKYNERDKQIDKFLTSRLTGIPVMLALLCAVFWITISGANVPSQLLSEFLFKGETVLLAAANAAGLPPFLYEMLIFGAYRVLAWVISVMLPPMAIFFPLFTLLEDLGYLPRIAFNLDKTFKKCCACGKQALTMCMGFGCNAAGIVGCRIIDSPRERLIAMITNSFVPCNGRFPILIAIIAMFFSGGGIKSALILTTFVVLGIGMTFLASKLLSMTVLKGQPSSFTLELPPYRRPAIGRIIVSSVFDRTLFVLGRAAAVAAPAGLIIWIFANVNIGGASLLNICCTALDAPARFIGLDGVILMAFILGFPANETVIPIMVMAYMATGSITAVTDLTAVRHLLLDNGWTWLTAVNTMIFTLMHWPCSTTLLTVKKETGSKKWTFAAFAVPALCGAVLCFAVTWIVRIFAYITGLPIL